MVVDEGDGDGDGEGDGVEVVDPRITPPPPSPVASQSPRPQVRHRPEAGPIPYSARVLEQGCAGDQPVFSSRPHSHMTVIWIFRSLIRCLIRRKEG